MELIIFDAVMLDVKHIHLLLFISYSCKFNGRIGLQNCFSIFRSTNGAAKYVKKVCGVTKYLYYVVNVSKTYIVANYGKI